MASSRTAIAEPPRSLVRRREHDCRLTPRRRLTTIEEAHSFLADRGMLTTMPSSHLPSLFGACEPPSDPDARGFARLPPDKWWWDFGLADMTGVHRLKIHRGKALLLDERLIPVIAPLCQHSLASAEA